MFEFDITEPKYYFSVFSFKTNHINIPFKFMASHVSQVFIGSLGEALVRALQAPIFYLINTFPLMKTVFSFFSDSLSKVVKFTGCKVVSLA